MHAMGIHSGREQVTMDQRPDPVKVGLLVRVPIPRVMQFVPSVKPDDPGHHSTKYQDFCHISLKTALLLDQPPQQLLPDFTEKHLEAIDSQYQFLQDLCRTPPKGHDPSALSPGCQG